MSERSVVYLKDRQSGQLVEATLLDGLDRAEVEGAEGQWIPFLQEQLQKLKGVAYQKKSGQSIATGTGDKNMKRPKVFWHTECSGSSACRECKE
jgi:hypothetical protein